MPFKRSYELSGIPDQTSLYEYLLEDVRSVVLEEELSLKKGTMPNQLRFFYQKGKIGKAHVVIKRVGAQVVFEIRIALDEFLLPICLLVGSGVFYFFLQESSTALYCLSFASLWSVIIYSSFLGTVQDLQKLVTNYVALLERSSTA